MKTALLATRIWPRRLGSANSPRRLRYRLFAALFCFVLTSPSCESGQAVSSSSSLPPTPAYPWKGTWTLAWSDEFAGTNGSSPDSTKWVFETGGGGWGNQELQTYTSRAGNVHIQDGSLAITAAKETLTGSDGITRNYTSARLKTAGKFSQQYGKFEARIKIPSGHGMWPAFWILGDNIGSARWPACGEIDVMENIGHELSIVHGSMHGPGASGGKALTAPYTLPNGQKFSDDYHTFALEWEPNVARFYVDGNLYETRTPADLPAGATWVYDHPFFILLNLAVGGAWPGSPDQSTIFPQTMLVDYVRVYARR
jgi:beta-glucanase (GH16 family)